MRVREIGIPLYLYLSEQPDNKLQGSEGNVILQYIHKMDKRTLLYKYRYV